MKELVTYVGAFLIAVALTIGVLVGLVAAGFWVMSFGTPLALALGIGIAAGAPTAVWMGWAWLHDNA